MALSSTSMADEVDTIEKLHFNIPQQGADTALTQFAEQADLTLIFPIDVVRDRTANRLVGEYPIEEAVQILLAGTGLTPTFRNRLVLNIATDTKSGPKGEEMNAKKKIGIAAIFAAIFAGPGANAQDDEASVILDEIVVTGSHIKRDGYDERAPIQIFDQEALKATGASNVIDVAKNLAINIGSELVNDDGDLTGTNQFNLRGLGLSSTLTLINGRRGGTSTVADGAGYQFLDVNSIPLNAIGRLEILTNGASATYGSEAVAGVVNIITRKGQLDGFELTAERNESVNDVTIYGFALGRKSDRGAFGIYGTYYEQTGAERTDFDFIRTRLNTDDPLINAFASSRGSPGTYYRADVDNSGSLPSITLRPGALSSADVDCAVAGGLDRNDGLCRLNFAEQRGELPQEERFQLFAEGDLDISEKLNVFAEASFSRNLITRFQEGSKNHARGSISGDAFNGEKYIPADHAFNFWTEDPRNPLALVYRGPTIDANGNATWSGNDEQDWANGLLQAVDLVCRCRPLGHADGYPGPFLPIEIEHQFLRSVVGADIALPKSWSANVSYMYSVNNRTRNEPWNFLTEQYDGVNPLNPSAIGTGAWNPFGTRVAAPDLISPKDGTSTAGNSFADLKLFMVEETRTARTEQKVWEAIFSGETFSLPNGEPVSAAFGVQYRTDTLARKEDEIRQNELDGDLGAQANIDAEFNTLSYFAEAIAPISDSFELQLAVRHENFKQSGDTTDPKIAARWQATDGLAVRASYGTSFQNPTVLQKGRTASFREVVDSCTGGGNFQNVHITEGNANLKPQSSENLNIGFVMQPIDSLRLSIDVWQFDYTDLIVGGESAQGILDQNFAAGCGPDPRIVRDGSGQIMSTTTSSSNAGTVVTDGLDLDISYSHELGQAGTLRLRSNWTYINSFDVETASGATVDASGNRNATVGGFRPVPKLRGNVSVLWNLGRHNAVATVRYNDAYTNDITSQGVAEIESMTTVDLQYTLVLEDLLGNATSAQFTLGFNNVFDEDPPDIGGRPGYDRFMHDPRGRQVYGRVTLQF